MPSTNNFFSDMQTFLDAAMANANSLLDTHDQSDVEAIRSWLQSGKKSYGEKAQGIKRYLPAIQEQAKNNNNYQKLLNSINAVVKILELANLIEQVQAIIKKKAVEEIAAASNVTAVTVIHSVNPKLLDYHVKFNLVNEGNTLDEEDLTKSVDSLMIRVLKLWQNNTAEAQSTIIGTFRILRERIVELQTAKQYWEESTKQVLALGEKNIGKLSENIRINCWEEICKQQVLGKIAVAAADLKTSLQSCTGLLDNTKQNLIGSTDSLALSHADGQDDFDRQAQLQDQLQESIGHTLQQPSFQEKTASVSEVYKSAADAVTAPIPVIERKIRELQGQKKQLEDALEKKVQEEKLQEVKANKALIIKKYVDVDGLVFDKIQTALVKSQQFTDLLRYPKSEKQKLVKKYLDNIRAASNLDELYNAVHDETPEVGEAMRKNTALFGTYSFFHACKSTTDTLAIRLNTELNRLVKEAIAEVEAKKIETSTQETSSEENSSKPVWIHSRRGQVPSPQGSPTGLQVECHSLAR